MVWDSSDGQLEFADNAQACFGNDDDLKIGHNGSNSFINERGTGGLQIFTSTTEIRHFGSNNPSAIFNPSGAVDLYYNNSNKLQTKTDGVNITGELECDSLDVDGDVDFDGGQLTFSASANTLDFADDAKAQFGAGDDLQIFHSGNHSFIKDTGTGALFVCSDSFNVNNAAANQTIIKGLQGAQVELYHASIKKFETTAYGVDVTGTTQSDTLIVTGVSTVASLIFSAGTNTNGVSYFDANGQVQSTVSPASGISTSNSILTTNASGVPIWTDTIDCGTF
jgi:hypothetical protein